jgi:hypothetical protein
MEMPILQSIANLHLRKKLAPLIGPIQANNDVQNNIVAKGSKP